MGHRGVARARLPSYQPEEGRGAAAGPRRPARSARSRPGPASPQPRLVPADCGHVTPRANGEGPGRGAVGPRKAQQTPTETAERAAAPNPCRAPGPGTSPQTQQSHHALRPARRLPPSVQGLAGWQTFAQRGRKQKPAPPCARGKRQWAART